MSNATAETVQAFALDALAEEDVSVSLEDDGERAVCTCTAHDGQNTVDGGQVCALANDHGLRVRDVRSDLESGALEVEVTADGE